MYIRHIVTEMDESMVQKCVLCGETISDYRNAMWPLEQGPPKGFGTGPVYVKKGTPTITTTILQPADAFESCV